MMIIGINSIFSPDLLATLRVKWFAVRNMVVDGNYSALEYASTLIRLGGLTLSPVMDALSSAQLVNDIHYQFIKICKNMYQKN